MKPIKIKVTQDAGDAQGYMLVRDVLRPGHLVVSPF